jgi:hypothetical protein
MKDAAYIEEHMKGMVMVKTMIITKKRQRAINEVKLNNVNRSSDSETCSSKLNDDTCEGKKLV